nr:VCBS repeat-containing protein [Bacteroidota bacterium]
MLNTDKMKHKSRLSIVVFCLSIFQSALTIAQQQIFSHKQLITEGRVWDVAFDDLNKDGSGVFSEATNNLTKNSAMAVGDIDLNGQMDIVFGKTIWLNNGNNQFTQQRILEFEGRVFGLWLNDIDKDEDLDLFYSTSIKENSLI